MKSYGLKCRRNTENINPKVSKTSNGRTMYYQNVQYAVVKNQDLLKIKKLLTNLGVRAPLSKEPILGDILF